MSTKRSRSASGARVQHSSNWSITSTTRPSRRATSARLDVVGSTGSVATSVSAVSQRADRVVAGEHRDDDVAARTQPGDEAGEDDRALPRSGRADDGHERGRRDAPDEVVDGGVAAVEPGGVGLVERPQSRDTG